MLEDFHGRFLAGEFTLDEARLARMQALFATFDRRIDDATAGRVAHLYREQHQANRRLVAGAIELLEALRGRCRMGIVTNNSSAEQREKLRALDIVGFFDAVVISEEVGVTKPDPMIFALALQGIGVDAADALFIGDNWTNDIAGALAAGMKAIWLDREPETPAPAGLPGQKSPERPAIAVVSDPRVSTIYSLAPCAPVIATIKTTFNKRTPGVKKHEQLETLAT